MTPDSRALALRHIFLRLCLLSITVLFPLVYCGAALKLRSLRIHLPRWCRYAVFQYKPTVSLRLKGALERGGGVVKKVDDQPGWLRRRPDLGQQELSL